MPRKDPEQDRTYARERARKLRRETPGYDSLSRLRSNLKKRGLTPQRYDELLAAQGGRCAICPTTDPGGGRRWFAVDHDHVTGVVRGLLCLNCNVHKVGSNTVETARLVLSYLERYNHKE